MFKIKNNISSLLKKKPEDKSNFQKFILKNYSKI